MTGFGIREIVTVSMVLFAVIDIIGTIPIIIDLRAKFEHIESEKASGAIMIVFLFIGEEFLNLIGIDVHSFAVAGSFVLFFLALEMILGENGLGVIRKTFGVVLLAIAVKLFAANVKGLFV